jgi:regulator of sigma E protease
MHILKFIFILLEVLLLFNLLIFVHELGHFLAARWRGLKIDRFAIWFGKPIWKKKINGVEYALGCIPAGGYVALPQMAPMDAIEGKTEETREPLPAISPMDKIIVAFAGPLFSFLLAVAFAVLVWGVGRPINEADKTRVIGWVERGGPAWNAGLRAGDEITEIDGHKIVQFSPSSHDSVTWRIVTSEGTNIAIKYLRDGREQTAYASPYRRPTQWYERKALRQVLIAPARDAIIHDVITNSPASAAGLQRGDAVVAINGQKIYSVIAVLEAEEAMTNANAKPISLTIQRGERTFDVQLAAEKPMRPLNSEPSFGIGAWEDRAGTTLIYPTPAEQIRSSATQIIGTLRALFSRKSDVSVQQLGGAVMIIRVYTNLFDSPDGWRLVLWFSVVMNVNLALLNLLPFPVLDGGHITLALLETIRRRPVSGALLNYLQSACAVALIAFMLFIAFFDTGDWVRSARRDRNEPIVFAPKN